MAKKKSTNPQKELVIVMILSLLLGAGAGFAIGAIVADSESDNAEVTTHTDKKDGHGHGDDLYEVNADVAPTVDLLIEEDAKSGYNVAVITSNFSFSPDNVNGDNVIGEGHAHLYVDGEKVGRLYGPAFHYDGSFEGTKTFRVTLNANDHSEYAVDGKVIEASVDVTHDSDAEGHAESHKDDHPHSHN